jgi:predicted Zn-dependent protease
MHNNNQIIIQAKAIANQGKEQDLEQAETILLDYLKENPTDTQAWLLLSMIEWTPPLEDFERIIQWTSNILSYDPTNAYALLVFAEAHWFKGGINETGYVALCNAQSNDPYVMAMIEVAKAEYIARKGGMDDEYEEILKKSIKYGPDQARNYQMLGKLYIKQGKVAKGETLIKKSLENREKATILKEQEEYDLTSLTRFLNEFYTGL